MKYYHFRSLVSNYLVIILSDSEENAKRELHNYLEDNRKESIGEMEMTITIIPGFGAIIYSGYGD